MAPEDWRGGGATPLRITPTRTPSAIHPPDAGDKIVQNSAAGGEQHWGTQLGISDAIAINQPIFLTAIKKILIAVKNFLIAVNNFLNRD